MKAGFTKIAVILDRSGSMASIRDAMISGVNEFIEGLKKQEGECEVFAMQFDSSDPYEVLFDKPLAEVPKLTAETYVPRGGTPLIDAMGYTIDNLGKQIADKPENERPEHVIVLIVTDGEENASQKYGDVRHKKRIADMIQHQQDVYKWVFTFMGANQDAVLVAEEYNIPVANTVTYTAGAANVRHVVSPAMAMFSNSIRSGNSQATASAGSYTPSVRMAAADVNLDSSWGSLRPDKVEVSVTNATDTQIPTTTTEAADHVTDNA